jgi:hypothetical protein
MMGVELFTISELFMKNSNYPFYVKNTNFVGVIYIKVLSYSGMEGVFDRWDVEYTDSTGVFVKKIITDTRQYEKSSEEEHNQNKNSNVVSFFDRNKGTQKKETEKKKDEYNFSALMEKNKKRKEQIKTEVSKSNKGIVRSFGLKK